MTLWFLVFIGFFAAALSIAAWALLGIVPKRQAIFSALMLILAGITGAVWQTSSFLAGAILLIVGSGITTTYLEKITVTE